MNLILIGNNTHDIAMDIWRGNTNFTVVDCTDIKDKNFVKYMKDRHLIVETTKKQFEEKYKEIDTFLEFCQTHKFIPLFISATKKSFEETMYNNVEEYIQSAVLYYAGEDKEKKGLKELINIAQGYLIDKGLIDDNIVRTPKKRKRSTSKK